MGRPPPRRGHFLRGGSLTGLYLPPLIRDLRGPGAFPAHPDYDSPVSDDPFPRERVAAMLRRLPAYLRLAWRLAREPLLNRARRAAVVAAAGYLASPVDLVPGVIPVLGQLDDVAVALAAIRLALSGLRPDRRRYHLEAVGLADADLTADLRTTGATAAWLLRAAARTTARAAKVGGRAAVAGAGVAGRAAVSGAGLAARGSKSLAASAAGAVRSASVGARNRLARRGDPARTADALPVELDQGDPPQRTPER